jgi:hypothetical protein
MSKTKKIILIVALVAVVIVAGWYGFQKYENWSFWREMKSQADKFTSEQDRLKVLREADTHGGKTPQETLEMFIAAVEAGNYELASKYFVVEKQKKWFDNLFSIKNANKFDVFLLPIKEAQKIAGEYSENKMAYVIYDPVLIDFIKYPPTSGKSMKYRWHKIVVILALLLCSGAVFAYDDKTTHPAITDEIVDFHNLFADQKLTSEEKELYPRLNLGLIPALSVKVFPFQG